MRSKSNVTGSKKNTRRRAAGNILLERVNEKKCAGGERQGTIRLILFSQTSLKKFRVLFSVPNIL